MELVQVLPAVGTLVAVAIGVAYVRSGLARQRTSELADLAQTRGDRVKDLEAHVGRLEERLIRMEGQMQALQLLKSQEIAVEVVRLMRDTGVTTS